MHENKKAAFKPCGHYCACLECVEEMRKKGEDKMKCPICTAKFEQVYKPKKDELM
jgi:hypothetical protein